jgi:type I restriction-modification system DNA methylase subunit
MSQQTLFSTLPQDVGLSDSYTSIYQSLRHLREIFHKSGRFDDSNMKLDEVAKLLSVYAAYKRGLLSSFPGIDGNYSGDLISDLQIAFAEAAKLDCYLDQEGESVFGTAPRLALRSGDETLARDLVQLVIYAVDAASINRHLDHPFDVLNEAFGHFVRDNFRSNIEDAQYMTPPEVVEFMVELALHDVEKEVSSKSNNTTFIVADPCCGVGSFLTAFYHKAKKSEVFDEHALRLVGQDKAARMVRLSKVNLSLFDVPQHTVASGSSLERESPLTELNGKVDLILTNPPFGARFSQEDVKRSGEVNLPFFTSLRKGKATIGSELLFVDRNISLLREGGLLAMVLPDSVISSKGMAGLLRQYLRANVIVKAIVELPAATFAQAGTRTKTSILYLEKSKPLQKTPKTAFIAKAEELGFEVGSRKGVQVKVAKGQNELPAILERYKRAKDCRDVSMKVWSVSPSAVTIDYQNITENSWTPNHYNATHLQAIEHFSKAEDITVVSLSDLAEFATKSRKTEPWYPDSFFISVLHVIGEGMLDIPSIREYAPKTPGYPVQPGEVLLSKINPRIPRVTVVPQFATRTLCSTEFEVMKPREGVDPYHLAFLLLTDAVQHQVHSLTSGTSASHNRIKAEELEKVKVPLPVSGSLAEERFNSLMKTYRGTVESVFKETFKLSTLRASEEFWTDNKASHS